MPKTMLSGLQEVEVRIRPIKNGFIVSRTKVKPAKGKNDFPRHDTEEEFFEKMPKDLKIG